MQEIKISVLFHYILILQIAHSLLAIFTRWVSFTGPLRLLRVVSLTKRDVIRNFGHLDISCLKTFNILIDRRAYFKTFELALSSKTEKLKTAHIWTL